MMRSRLAAGCRLAAALVACGTWLVGASNAAAQTAIVTGMVVDMTGGALPGALVTLKTPTGERTAVAGPTGAFMFDGVPDTSLTVTVAFDGFAPLTVTLDRPRAGVRMVLSPLPVSEAVTVEAPGPAAMRTTTATRTETPLRDVPQAISVVPRELMSDLAMRSMADVVQYVPGVGMAQGEGHRDAPIFRGNTSTADFFVDGIRDDAQYLRDLYNLERIEVLKGPNGMIFGRGGVGGVINRVTRQANWMPVRELVVQGGSWGYRRLTGDLGHAMNGVMAARLTAMYENSDTYRDAVGLERYGLNPTVAFALSPATTLRAGYEFFHDERTADRGVPSFQGRPLAVDPSTFFGSPSLNHARITLNAVSSSLDHRLGDRIALRNRVRFAVYDKFYSNLVPGAVDAAASTVSLTGYNSGTDRRNLFNQTDVNLRYSTGPIEHTILVGAEFGRQVTDNVRLTAYFSSISPTTTSIAVPLRTPATTPPVEFRAAAADPDNHGIARSAAVYVQDQIAITKRIEAVVGVRYDRFTVDFVNNRTGAELSSRDDLVAPRLGIVYKPVRPVSIYASYSRAYLPRAGEQLASLTPTTQALDPEAFRNVEGGAKWEVLPSLALTAAVYRLDRGNVAAADPNNPGILLLLDAERTVGIELEVAGNPSRRWTIQGGYAYQDAEITRTVSALARAGARLGQVPRHTLSLWNRYDFASRFGAGLGVLARGDSFVATDNTVVLPGAVRADAALFFGLTRQLHAQVTVENLLDERYYWSAHNNNNILPGSPRAVRVALTTAF